MGMLKIKVVDAAGAPLAGQAMKVSVAGAVQSSAEGMTQFLTDTDAALQIDINGATVWSGNSAELARQEVFAQPANSFKRVQDA